MERRLAAILLTDMVGYSRLMGLDEDGTIARQKAHREQIIDPSISVHGGRIVKSTGDGLLVEFPSVVDAVKCAVEVQMELARHDTDVLEDQRIQYRIGINLGDIVIDGEDILGDGVNVAARLEALADPGGICVSGTVHDQLAGKLDVVFEDAGEQTVKNVPRPVRVWYWQTGQGVRSPSKLNEPPALPDKPSIAVLPFANMSGDPDQEYFADGIAEDLITALSRFHWFFVIARNSSFSYKGASPDVRLVARDLGVRYVLEGSVRKAGKRVRITAQLIDAPSGRHVWADRYDHDLEDVFAVQDQITEAIVGAVAPSFVSAEARRVERKVPESFDAWDYVMRGNWYLWRFGNDDIVEATRLFEAAVSLDKTSAPAFSGLSLAYLWSFMWGWADDTERSRDLAHQAALRAIDLDENDAWAHAALGCVNTYMREFDSALRCGQRALEINPNLSFAEGMLAHAYASLGDNNNVTFHADRAERLSPRDPARVLWYLARSWAAILTVQYEESLAWARKMVESYPELQSGWRHLAADYAQLNRIEEARQAVTHLLRLAPNSSISLTEATVPYAPKTSKGLERYLDALRKAGLPE